MDKGVCENLPYEDAQFDLALMVTTICFIDDVEKFYSIEDIDPVRDGYGKGSFVVVRAQKM